jgi:hypothetical protein
MDAATCETTMSQAEAAVAAGNASRLGEIGFWKAVTAAKKSPELREQFAERIAAVDRKAFEQWAWITVPIRVGTALMIAATVAGIALVGAGYYLDEPWNALFLLAGSGVLLVTTHGLGHLAVGARSGIRFTHWFIGAPLKPQPGVKIDYASYLHTPARRRAAMHASGAVITKIVPFAMLGAAWGMDAPGWAWWVLGGVGVLQVLTDAAFSGRSSDWKRYRRERRLAEAGH